MSSFAYQRQLLGGAEVEVACDGFKGVQLPGD